MSGIPLLISARDPGAAGHVLELTRALRLDGTFNPKLIAAEAALELLRAAGERPQEFPASGSEAELLEAANAVLDQNAPAVLLASLSSFGVGVDEALLAAAKGKLPTAAYQDFWGDVNLGMGVPADVYLTLDEHGARLTHERFGLDAVAVGSPKHSAYRQLDQASMRAEALSLARWQAGPPTFAFFGQSPEVPGHDRTFELTVAALASLEDKPRLVIRDHPKFKGSRKVPLAALAAGHGLATFDATAKLTPEHWLLACDSMLTLYSVSGLDHAYLSSFSTQPIGTAVYLLPFAESRDFVRDQCGLIKFPIVSEGMGELVESEHGLSAALRRALEPETRARYHRASRALGEKDPAVEVLAVLRKLVVPAGSGSARD